MAHGIYTDRDFQVGEEMAWHNLTTIKIPALTDFPKILSMPLFYGDDCKPAAHGEKAYFIPIAEDDKLPVAPPTARKPIAFSPRMMLGNGFLRFWKEPNITSSQSGCSGTDLSGSSAPNCRN